MWEPLLRLVEGRVAKLVQDRPERDQCLVDLFLPVAELRLATARTRVGGTMRAASRYARRPAGVGLIR